VSLEFAEGDQANEFGHVAQQVYLLCLNQFYLVVISPRPDEGKVTINSNYLYQFKTFFRRL